MDEDPMPNIAGEPRRTAFMRFLTETVGIRPKRPYLLTSFEIIQTWDFTLGGRGVEGFASTTEFLAKAMRLMPFMRVYLAMGRFDLAGRRKAPSAACGAWTPRKAFWSGT